MLTLSQSDRVQLVWFKRDLRVADHAPLWEASRRGPVLGLYIYEPEVIQADDFDACHLGFVNESLSELRDNLRRLGGGLIMRVGRLPEVFAELHRERPLGAIWAHQETGNAVTYARDRRVARWAREAGVAFYEAPQHGVVRPLRTRDGWAAQWQARMSRPTLPEPDALRPVSGVGAGAIQTAADLNLEASTKTEAQRGGEAAGKVAMRSFLQERGRTYRHDLSSPVTGEEGCSRLSPHLAWGCLSMRQVYQAAERRTQELRRRKSRGEGGADGWLESLTSFQSRLRWHCHFIQKLEDEPRIEHENINRAFDGLRENDFNEEYFEAWRRGETGYPMVDACMRALHRTGWINFRMRAMLVSFASYHLWLHWRQPAIYLARQFVDYEPGIHYSQFQMQAGVTGINTVRIYSPIKQVHDQDPHGLFIRRYVPELADVPDEHLAEPHKLPPILQQDCGCVIGRDYPAPIVDHRTAYAAARRRMDAHRRRAGVREQSERVFQKHGSRRRPMRR